MFLSFFPRLCLKGHIGNHRDNPGETLGALGNSGEPWGAMGNPELWLEAIYRQSEGKGSTGTQREFEGNPKGT